ncbi:hypothetical protein [Microvirga puerhi]|uniref:Lipoprotein n=1 Tax=Microvirga puerhi TaxID=2876078 RepID=A0ABS7VQS4_9HYPH|nr:hypothetical protein [Microvirga puerhi]MBZ6077870.1 hypothetical protein [Microvirga puerhi]
MLKQIIVGVAVVIVLVGCKTTEEAAQSVRAKWIGQPVDQFFIENGPPVSSFPLESGGTIYTWRGGEVNYVRPAQYETRPAFGASPLKVSERTTTVTTQPSPGVTVTQTRTTNSSFGYSGPQVTTLVRPAQNVHLACEAQITADQDGTIISARINKDSEGAGFSFSRCAEVFGE